MSALERWLAFATALLLASPMREPFPRAVIVTSYLRAPAQAPPWQLVVTDPGGYGDALGRFVIDASGDVVWDGRLPVRHFTLTADELDRLHRLDGLSADDGFRPDPDTPWWGQRGDPRFRFGDRSFAVMWGDGRTAGASQSSAMSDELLAILDEAIDRYAIARLASAGPMSIELDARSVWTTDHWTPRGARYHLAVSPDGGLEVKRGRAVIYDEHLTPRETVDLLDALLAGPAMPVSDDDVARGHATIGARTMPVRLEEYALPGLDLLTSELESATRL